MRRHTSILLLLVLLTPLAAQVAVVHPSVTDGDIDASRMAALLQGRVPPGRTVKRWCWWWPAIRLRMST
jgi:hypothetical protein